MTTNQPSLIIESHSTGLQWPEWSQVWRYRELMYFMTLRDIKLRYKETVLGGLWTILQPLITSGVFTLLFGKLAQFPSEGVPYGLFCFCGVLFWNYFSNSIFRASYSLVGNGHLLGKVYFPRFLLPLAALIPPILDFMIGFVFFTIVLVSMGRWDFLARLPLLVPWFFLVLLQLSGLALGLSALTVRFRDVGNLMPLILQLGLFITPVLYAPSALPEAYQFVARWNPVTGLVLSFRSIVLGTPFSYFYLGVSIVASLLAFAIGSFYFSKMQAKVVDKL